MTVTERQLKIVDMLTCQTFISLPQLAKVFKVSVMTIRRDVAELSAQGQIIAVRGGVKSISAPSNSASNGGHHPSLLRAAWSQVGNNRIIFLDSGKLCFDLARYIPWREDMTVITNDFEIANHIISNTHAGMYFIGGKLCREDNTSHHLIAQEILKSINFELLFLAPEHWTDRGAWHHEQNRQNWYQLLTGSAGKIVLLAESKVYGKSGMFRLYPLEKADVILTDYTSSEYLNSGVISPQKLHILV
ncbi:TPA: DeoR/GlpR transcriptional regulator [Enterobacter hormaechei subsp. steigerwaltii]|nr:DeoR/GlpR transcriptional regulator [Enterobacter hormaechei subsp. steigerwaltii]HBC0022764.1 DeoR/GlpR transcriptional regulator [Enterobacter hormaechei subsp. steigerwaltii]